MRENDERLQDLIAEAVASTRRLIDDTRMMRERAIPQSLLLAIGHVAALSATARHILSEYERYIRGRPGAAADDASCASILALASTFCDMTNNTGATLDALGKEILATMTPHHMKMFLAACENVYREDPDLDVTRL